MRCVFQRPFNSNFGPRIPFMFGLPGLIIFFEKWLFLGRLKIDGWAEKNASN
jgi:hypothetical protein